MKNRLLIIALLASSIVVSSKGCPTCQGRIEKESPPFFTDDFYNSEESMDYVYQQLLESEEAQEQNSQGTS